MNRPLRTIHVRLYHLHLHTFAIGFIGKHEDGSSNGLGSFDYRLGSSDRYARFDLVSRETALGSPASRQCTNAMSLFWVPKDKLH